jgi:hypothetical protein
VHGGLVLTLSVLVTCALGFGSCVAGAGSRDGVRLTATPDSRVSRRVHILVRNSQASRHPLVSIILRPTFCCLSVCPSISRSRTSVVRQGESQPDHAPSVRSTKVNTGASLKHITCVADIDLLSLARLFRQIICSELRAPVGTAHTHGIRFSNSSTRIYSYRLSRGHFEYSSFRAPLAAARSIEIMIALEEAVCIP